MEIDTVLNSGTNSEEPIEDVITEETLAPNETLSSVETNKQKTNINENEAVVLNSNNTNNITEQNNTKENDGENISNIKRFLEKDEHDDNQEECETSTKAETQKITDKELCNVLNKDSSSIASNVMDMILSGAEATISKDNNEKPMNKATKLSFTSPDKGNCNNTLSVGTKVEAKDYDETWHPAEITEVDFEEMEVLVHYVQFLKKPDEWISVSSPRLRPFGTKTVAPQLAAVTPVVSITRMAPTPVAGSSNSEDKHKVVFVEGERCLARWRDNRRFMATIQTDLRDGHFQIMFDDGFIWKCTASRLSKLKDSQVKAEPVDSPSPSQTVSTTDLPGCSTPVGQPPYHTHLFDPARDYLGSKSERRALKRKLNIKEIFNIGQKKMKKEYIPREKQPKVPPLRKSVAEKKPKVVKKKNLDKAEVKTEPKSEIPDAVASIIGTVIEEVPETVKQEPVDVKSEDESVESVKEEVVKDEEKQVNQDKMELCDIVPKNTTSTDPVEEEQKLENFDLPVDPKHEEVIDKIKEVINKLEDGLNEDSKKVDLPKPEKEEQVKEEVEARPVSKVETTEGGKRPSKVKKGKKLRLLQEKKVKKQVEKVRSELEEMKRQVEAMRLEMRVRTEEMARSRGAELLPGEWACRWLNGQPVGAVTELPSEARAVSAASPALPRRSVQVEDNRLPKGWAKHMVRRSFGSSAGKWDVVLISDKNQRFHTRVEMRNFLDKHPEFKDYEEALLDFGIHLKLARRLGWVTETPDGETEAPTPLPAGTLSTTSPLVKRKPLCLKRPDKKKIKRKKLKSYCDPENFESSMGLSSPDLLPALENEPPPLVAEEGYVYVGSLKVQIIENLLRCPAEGCFKNFRNNTLIKMHIKHYHRELRKMLGATPKVLDLAYERRPELIQDVTPIKKEPKTIKVKIPRHPKPQKVLETPKIEAPEIKAEDTVPPQDFGPDDVPPALDSPKLRSVLATKPVKRPKVLLPVRRAPESPTHDDIPDEFRTVMPRQPVLEIAKCDQALDFETAISTHTVTKPCVEKSKMLEKKKFSEDEDGWLGASSDLETRSSFPRSGSPDSKSLDLRMMPPMSSESNDDQKEPNMYMYDEFGRRIKIVHMKRSEIINCHCGFREEDGLMVQCELCLCWQHALCHNIQREADVPEKYTCSICLNPRRGRRSMRFVHDQDRLYEGLLPGGRGCETLRRSHELAGNLLRIQDALHAMTVKYHAATKKNHPKLYLWAKDWETTEIGLTQEKLNSDYSDLNIMISEIGKENLPVKSDDNLSLDIKTPLDSEDQDSDKFSQRDSLSQTLLSGLLSSPGAGSLDLPITTSELEKLARAVEEQEFNVAGAAISAPQPEAAIENEACRERLLRHLQRCHALVDARLDSIEAQVAELESQDPSFEDDETADYFPRTKQTIQMLMRDLDVMEELGTIT